MYESFGINKTLTFREHFPNNLQIRLHHQRKSKENKNMSKFMEAKERLNSYVKKEESEEN